MHIFTNIQKNCGFNNFSYLCLRYRTYARMAESVDALVSNTSGRKAVPVRPRLRVLNFKGALPPFFCTLPNRETQNKPLACQFGEIFAF